MRDRDAATKQYMSHKDVVADAFNFYLYGGEQRILPERLRKMDATELASLYGKKEIGSESVQKIRDELILWEMMRDEDAVYVILGIENQTHIDYAMPVRDMLYDALQYARQVEESKRSYRQKKNAKMNSAEFLSGFRKEDKLMPVITLVVYFGEESWDGPQSIREMLNTKDEVILSYVQDYKLNLIVPATIRDEEFDKFHTDLGAILQFIKHQSQEDNTWMQGYKRFEQVEREAVDVINKLTGTKIKYEENEEVVNMCRAWDVPMKKAKEEGLREGHIAGLKEGHSAGLQEGHSAGLREGHSTGLKEGHSAGLKEGISTAKAVFKAYISGKNAEEIAKELKMPLEEVEEVLA